MIANQARLPSLIQPRAPTFILIAVFVLVYVIAARLGLTFAVVGSTVTLVWPPSGLSLFALLRYGHRLAPGVFLGAFIANASTGLPFEHSALIAVGNTGEALIGYFLLARVVRFRRNLSERRDIFALFFCAGCGATIFAATLGALATVLANYATGDEFFRVLVTWWLGDMMGILVIAPFLLVASEQPFPRMSSFMAGEAGALAALVAALSYNIFGRPELAGQGYYPAALAVFPFLIWGALRFYHWGAVSVTLIVSAIAIEGTASGTGPFAVSSSVDSLIGWCAFANILGVTGLLLAALRAEQQRDSMALQQAHEVLESRVVERTEELVDAYARLARSLEVRSRLECDLVRVTEAQQKRIGQELHDGLGQYLTSLSFLAASLAERLKGHEIEGALAERIREMLGEAISTTRQVAQGLYPVLLESGGVIVAIGELLKTTQMATQVRCEFLADIEEPRFNPLVGINLYRFAQEAIANAIRHSKATRLSVHFSRTEGEYILRVSDNGVGISDQEIARPSGLGLQSLRQRANLLGGKFEIHPDKPGGTTVSIRYPAMGNVLP